MLKPFHAQGLRGWPFNTLERLLQQAAGSGGQGATDGSAHAAFWNALLAGDLHILGSVDDSGRASLPSYGFPGGDALVAFTSRELLQHSIAEELSYITMPARAFFQMTASGAGARIALNPCGPYGKEFTPQEIRSGLGGVLMRSDHEIEVAGGTQVLLGQLAEEPTALIDAVTTICRDDPTINAALLCAVAIPSTGDPRPHPLIGLDAADYPAARNTVGAAAQRWSKTAGLPVDIVDMNDGGTLCAHLRSSGRVLHQRNRERPADPIG
ncbi:MAG TPA: enhanced serine sensitivity protein SseB C-terminal domain-containing protein [Phycisphaerales bacterium]|nr:enhanced serine sensitivity protein SseB C-terminal domain-containing protein [Phycisphaerales bacterium]